MSDPKYNKYAGTVRFDDDNIVDIDLQPDTENITVKLNGSPISSGSGGDFYVDFSIDPEDESKTVANKTVGEIAEAVTAGLKVIGRFSGYINNVLDSIDYIPLTAIYFTEGNESAVFQCLGTVVEGQISIWNYCVDSGGVTYSEYLINIATQ